MEIKQLREDKFEVILHKEDLEKFNIEFLQFMSMKVEELEFFPIILNYIDKISSFSLKNKKIIFETFFIDNSYFLIEFYVIGILSSDGNFLPKIGKDFSVSSKVPLIFSFSSFDDICDFCNYLSNIEDQRFSSLVSFLELFKYKDDYFLILKDSIFSTDLFDFACLQISEFASFVSCSDILVSKIQELGSNINILNNKC
ncbi:MAG: adaptor protein MecA [Clostridia bacterium]|nr:adaptor protein MecA [Clostridia bacterium]